jgi:DNA-binding response OmpR family regulator
MTSIIVVEDNIQLNRLYCKALQKIATDVLPAATVQQSLTLLDSITPDILVLDMTMPDGTGLDVIKYLRSIPRCSKTRVIVTTGHSKYQMIAEEVGIDYYLYKPVSIPTLVDIVQRLR